LGGTSWLRIPIHFIAQRFAVGGGWEGRGEGEGMRVGKGPENRRKESERGIKLVSTRSACQCRDVKGLDKPEQLNIPCRLDNADL
jgi:hypothetical protein